MLRFFLGVVILLATAGCFTGLYLLIRHYHRQWWWQDRVNENELRKAIMEEADVQWEVAPDGFIRPVKRSQYGHERRGAGTG